MFDPTFFQKTIKQNRERFFSKSFIKNEFAKRVLDKLSFIKLNPKRIFIEGLDSDTEMISRLYPKARISESLEKNVTYDLAISHFRIQQTPNIYDYLKDLYRQLSIKGVLVLTSFNIGNLKEIKESWQIIDNKGHVNQMLDMHDIGDLLKRVKYQNIVMDAETLCVKYSDMKVLLKDIRELNEPLSDTKMRKTLTGKNRWKNFCQLFSDSGLSVSYEVFYGYGSKEINIPNKKNNLKHETMININHVKDLINNRM